MPPLKNAAFRLTVATNRPPPQLLSLFEDLAAGAPTLYVDPTSRNVAAHVMSFAYRGGGADVTILVSKSGGRYRLQGDCFQGLWLVLQARCCCVCVCVEGGWRGGMAAVGLQLCGERARERPRPRLSPAFLPFSRFSPPFPPIAPLKHHNNPPEQPP